MTSQLLSYIKESRAYFYKFGLVGASGIFVNEGLLALLTEWFHMQLAIAGGIAIETSIISNFLLNNFWTWRDRSPRPVLSRFARYHCVALVSGVTNYLILITLSRIGVHHLLANLVGIGVGTIMNFLLNHHWTFAAEL